MKKKNQKKTNWEIKELCSPKSNIKEYEIRKSNNISPYTLTGSGFNGKEISWKVKSNK